MCTRAPLALIVVPKSRDFVHQRSGEQPALRIGCVEIVEQEHERLAAAAKVRLRGAPRSIRGPTTALGREKSQPGSAGDARPLQRSDERGARGGLDAKRHFHRREPTKLRVELTLLENPGLARPGLTDDAQARRHAVACAAEELLDRSDFAVAPDQAAEGIRAGGHLGRLPECEPQCVVKLAGRAESLIGIGLKRLGENPLEPKRHSSSPSRNLARQAGIAVREPSESVLKQSSREEEVGRRSGRALIQKLWRVRAPIAVARPRVDGAWPSEIDQDAPAARIGRHDEVSGMHVEVQNAAPVQVLECEKEIENRSEKRTR